MATDVVGEITALMAMAKPRPRRTVPVPLVERLRPVHPLEHVIHAPSRPRRP